MLLVGLTGGIGSGKSTVAAMLADRGAEVIDADAIARELLAPGGAALADVVAEFGTDILDGAGRLDRRRLAGIVFSDPERRRRLEGLTHPHVAQRIADELERLGADPGSASRIAVVDHPLIVETGQADRYDVLVVVLAPEALRVERVVAERGLDAAEVEARIRAQADDDRRLAVASHVLRNDGDLGALASQVAHLHGELVALAERSG